MKTQSRPFAGKLIEHFKDKLKSHQFDVLMTASCSDYVGGASALAIPLGTYKSRLNRARNKLEKLMAKQMHPNGAPKWAPDGTMLNEDGSRSIFDDVDE